MKYQVFAVAVVFSEIRSQETNAITTQIHYYIILRIAIEIGIRECIQPYDCIMNEHDL